MNDNIIMENYLLVLKSNVEVFVHGTLESTFDSIKEVLNSCLQETINNQRDTFVTMIEQGIYTVEKVNNQAITKTLKKCNN